MLRRSCVCRVHLFSALVPHSSVSGPRYLSDEELAFAHAALAERASVLVPAGVDLATPLRVLVDTRRHNAHELRDAVRAFSDCVDAYRAELYKRTCRDAEQRLQLHEALMAAGFYQRAINTSELAGEAMRFVLHHYNFDVRRDVFITKRVHQYLYDASHQQQTQQQVSSLRNSNGNNGSSSGGSHMRAHAPIVSSASPEQLLRDLLLLERRLFGKYRFMSTGGRRWLVLGQPLSELTSDTELRRLLALPAVAQDGNFALSEADVVESKGLWKTLTLAPRAEAEASVLEVVGLHTAVADADTQYELRVQKPAPPKEFWERVRERLLRYWVMWLTLWLMFWAVDEEIIALVTLIYIKYKQTQVLEREAQKTGGKVYIARAYPHFPDMAK